MSLSTLRPPQPGPTMPVSVDSSQVIHAAPRANGVGLVSELPGSWLVADFSLLQNRGRFASYPESPSGL